MLVRLFAAGYCLWPLRHLASKLVTTDLHLSVSFEEDDFRLVYQIIMKDVSAWPIIAFMNI